MSRYVLAYVATMVAFCALDFVWLGVVAPTFYKSQLGPLLLQKPNLLPAGAFYVLYVAGLVLFCVMPALEADAWVRASIMGALLGLVAYATYDLSNLATLKNWTLPITLVDMAWGTVASALAATAGYFGATLGARISG